MVTTAADAETRGSTTTRRQLLLLALTVVGTPLLAGIGWMVAWQVARILPEAPTMDGTFTWAPIMLVFLGPALVLLALLALPAWIRPHSLPVFSASRLLVLIGVQSLVVFLFGVGGDWWRVGGFPTTWRVVSLELLAAALTLVPSLALVWRRDDGTRRGWRAYAVVAPSLVVVLLIAVASALFGADPYQPTEP